MRFFRPAFFETAFPARQDRLGFWAGPLYVQFFPSLPYFQHALSFPSSPLQLFNGRFAFNVFTKASRGGRAFLTGLPCLEHSTSLPAKAAVPFLLPRFAFGYLLSACQTAK
ncbi:MAG: hypothetical protein ACK5L3_05045 [Oscillospiraceae bacterium]